MLDTGTQILSTEFQYFLTFNDISHSAIATYNPENNDAAAENAMKTIKRAVLLSRIENQTMDVDTVI